ncbi:MAG TPA: hypothetical protein VE618_03700, partial [Myxococcaceae bacterium]|nr:hypothetical protein [Myxococcaceae bacterium]
RRLANTAFAGEEVQYPCVAHSTSCVVSAITTSGDGALEAPPAFARRGRVGSIESLFERSRVKQ